MTIAHLSDTHLGYRAYSRATPSGFNQRERDVMETYRQCLDQIADREPDLVVHAGDFFHVVRPSNATIVEAYRLLDSFQRRRRGGPFILVGGNHDTPRTSDSGNILKLFLGIPGVILSPIGAERHDVPELDCEVLCVPSGSLAAQERIDWVPGLGRKHAVLVMHGMAAGIVPMKQDFAIEQVEQDRWTYAALGDYHVHREFARNVCYAGSTDFTSNNIWEEAGTPKSWVWFDTSRGRIERSYLSPRTVLDLPPIDADGLAPEAIAERMLAQAVWSDADLPIVRQRILNVRPEVRQRLGIAAVREISQCAFFYYLVCTPPAAAAAGAAAHAPGTSLEASWSAHVAKADLPGGIARDALDELGLRLLKEVSEHEAAAAEA